MSETLAAQLATLGGGALAMAFVVFGVSDSMNSYDSEDRARKLSYALAAVGVALLTSAAFVGVSVQ